MCAMATAHVSSIQSSWKLPGVRDLLPKIGQELAASLVPHPNIQISPNSFRKLPGYRFNYDDVYKYCSPQQVRLPGTSEGFIKPESDLVPQRMSDLQSLHTKELYVATKCQPQLCLPPGASTTGVSTAPFGPASPFRLDQRPQQQATTPIGPHGNLESSTHASPRGRIASNDRHKRNEKHRRDVMGAFVQAADIIRNGLDIRKGLDHGILFPCPICSEDASNHESLGVSSIEPGNTVQEGVLVAPKKTKNKMLEESLMWEFSMVLHLWPHQVSSHLDGIRVLASQVAREKNLGMHNDFNRRSKWNADVRAQVLEGVLSTMELACARHGVDAGSDSARGLIMTPPSSSSSASPMVGHKRPREATDEEEDRAGELKRRCVL